jgi:hypothetical protein
MRTTTKQFARRLNSATGLPRLLMGHGLRVSIATELQKNYENYTA